MRILSFLLVSLMLAPAQAKNFRNAYIAFDLPGKWECAMEVTEWVCRSVATPAAKEAVIVLTAKERGPTDDMGAYEAHLKSPKTMLGRQGKEVLSKVVQVKTRQINGQSWVDALHQNSEIPDYYTRYMATVKDKLGIVVTFSAHQTVYTKYSQDFFNAILSLRVVADKSILGGSGAGGGMGGGEVIGVGGLPQDFGSELPAESSDDNTMMLLAGAVLGLGLIAFFLLRSKKKKKK